MAQLGWVYLDPQGGQHRIGLYHGDKTGHLLIHCNMRVIQFDFSVKESRNYSFFIEDELCELSILKEHGSYSYAFTTDRKVDTPLNRLRKANDRQNLKKVLWVAAGLLGLIACGVFGLIRFNKWQLEKRFADNSFLSAEAFTAQKELSAKGQPALAQFFLKKEGDHMQVLYGFTTADSVRTFGQFEVPQEAPYILPTGFPLADSDVFRVHYLPSNPRIHRLEFNNPGRTTITRYLQLAQTMEQQQHPDVSPEKCVCIVLTVAAKRDWPVLADFIFQGKIPKDNAQHNRDTYLRLIRDPDIAALLQADCWDK